MCITYCHRRSILYWNHEDCAAQCELARGPHGGCADCRHRQGALCGLTRAPLPGTGCCHWNVVLVGGPQVVTPAMLELLGMADGETAADALARWDAPYQVDGSRQVVVDPGRLGIPAVYGVGTESVGDEVWPW